MLLIFMKLKDFHLGPSTIDIKKTLRYEGEAGSQGWLRHSCSVCICCKSQAPWSRHACKWICGKKHIEFARMSEFYAHMGRIAAKAGGEAAPSI